MTFRKSLLAGLFALFAFQVHATPFPSLSESVSICDPNQPTHCAAPDGSGNLPITGTITASLGGFTPSASGARGTPLSVTTSDSSGTLPTGAVVIISNVGTTNPMYCNVNGAAATTSDQLISSSSWFAFTIPATITTFHCIATGGTTTANTLGGAGLATGAGGGGGGGVQAPLTGVTTAQTTAAASSLVAKASAGSIISVSGSAASGSYIMIFNATTAPADGAVTPLKCYGPMAAAGPFIIPWGVGPVLTMSTGATVVSSSTGCFTKTAVNAPFLSVEYQ